MVFTTVARLGCAAPLAAEQITYIKWHEYKAEVNFVIQFNGFIPGKHITLDISKNLTTILKNRIKNYYF